MSIRRGHIMAVVFAMVLSAPGFAADMEMPDFTGLWVGEVVLPNGNALPFEAYLGYNGNEVVGFLGGIGGPDVEIFESSVDGNTATFYSVRPIQGEDVVFRYDAELDGDTLHFDINQVNGQGMPLESTTTRVEPDMSGDM